VERLVRLAAGDHLVVHAFDQAVGRDRGVVRRRLGRGRGRSGVGGGRFAGGQLRAFGGGSGGGGGLRGFAGAGVGSGGARASGVRALGGGGGGLAAGDEQQQRQQEEGSLPGLGSAGRGMRLGRGLVNGDRQWRQARRC